MLNILRFFTSSIRGPPSLLLASSGILGGRWFSPSESIPNPYERTSLAGITGALFSGLPMFMLVACRNTSMFFSVLWSWLMFWIKLVDALPSKSKQ